MFENIKALPISLTSALLSSVVAIVHQASRELLSLYGHKSVARIRKHDGSALTVADLKAHQILLAELKKLTPNIPIISEESSAASILNRRRWNCLWLVDPLDGSEEFIKKTDEFTINVALIVNYVVVLGVVCAPALDTTYFAMDAYGAYKEEKGVVKRIFCSLPQHNIRVAVSNRPIKRRMKRFLKQLPAYTLKKAGSALKICLVAEGVADIYPCLGATYEWDVAAGHAIINNANGLLCDKYGRSFQYNRRFSLLNESFIVGHENVVRSYELHPSYISRFFRLGEQLD